MVARQLGAVLRLRQRTFLLRLEHDLLTEVRQLLILVRVVERDHVFQRMHRRGGAEPCEVLVHVGLELVHEHVELRFVELAERGDVRRIDDDRAARLHVGDGRFGDRIGRGAITEETIAYDADAGAAQRIPVECRRRPTRRPRTTGSCRTHTDAPASGRCGIVRI